MKQNTQPTTTTDTSDVAAAISSEQTKQNTSAVAAAIAAILSDQMKQNTQPTTTDTPISPKDPTNTSDVVKPEPNNVIPEPERQPISAINYIPEDTVIIYNNIVYQKDPTDPTQIIETFHKKNELGVLEPHTRIIKLEDGTTTINVKEKDKTEWKPLDLSEYDTLDANITKEGVLKALKTFAAPSKTQSGGLKSSHREAEKEEEQDDDASPPQIIKDDYTTTLIYKNLVYTSIPNEKWIQENYFFDDREDDSAPKNRKLRLTDSNKLELEDGNVFDIAYYDKRDNLTESKIIDILSKMGKGPSL